MSSPTKHHKVSRRASPSPDPTPTNSAAPPNAAKDATAARERIEECAYFLWLEKGRPGNEDEAIWLKAEAFVRRAGSGGEDVSG